MDGKARHASEPPAVARDAGLVESISLAKLPFQIAFLTQDHTIMEDDKCRHHQDYDPTRGQHEGKAHQREASTLVNRVSGMREEVRGDQCRCRFIWSDIGARLMEGAPRGD